MKKTFFILAVAFIFATAMMAEDAIVTIHANQGRQTIYKEIYGQFAEHLGSCVYGGLWVGMDSKIPNVNGYRKDVLDALKDLHVPVLRWPGGCYADDYHWRDGVGPVDQRPTKRNNRGGAIENNSFGTNEFLNLCEMLGCEPYISGNVGSGTVAELASWVEYMTSNGDTPMARLRRQNGRENPWHVKFLGIGNESWGCGGNMRPEYYADLYRRYATYCRNYDGNQLYRVASGASDYNYDWTKVMMKNIGWLMNGVSLHYYTVSGWSGSKGSATKFSDDDFYWSIGKCLEIEDVIKKHEKIMDESDPQKKIGLLVDEWGTWWDEEPGAVSNSLYQQNSMRDALVAALTLNVFHRHTDRIRMANIAQVVNVLQSMILTNDRGQMVLTPTYYVFEMYKKFQDATYLPTDVRCDSMEVRDNRKIPMVSASAAFVKGSKTIVLSLVNVSLDKPQEISIDIDNASGKNVSGRILTCKEITNHNDFDHSNVVRPAIFTDARIVKNKLKVKIPSKSVVILELK